MKKEITLGCIAILSLINSVFAVLPTPLITSPADGSVGNPANTIINWYNVTGATDYEFKINNDPALNGALVQTSVSSQFSSNELLYNTTYFWQVRALKTTGTPDSSAWTQIFSFTTAASLTITAPTNGALNQFPRSFLNWSNSGGVTNYQVQWDESAAFNSPTLIDSLLPDSVSDCYTGGLKFGTTYYWRARGMHALDTMDWTSAYTFTTLDSVFLSAPLSGSSFLSTSSLLNWDFISGITNYEVQIDKLPSFNSPALQSAVLPDSVSQWTTSNLDFGTNYYWRVRAWHASDTTQWSQVWDFSTLVSVTLTAPANNVTNQFPNVLLNWNYVSDPISYDVEYDTSASFSSPLYTYATNDTISEYKTAELLFGTKYFWRARIHNAADTSQWSATWSFTTIDVLNQTSPSNGAIDQGSRLTLNWTAVSGTNGYEVRADTVSDYSSPIAIYLNSITSNQQLVDLYFGTTYYWSVRAVHAKDTSLWTGNWTFTTADAVALSSPADQSINAAPRTNLNWSNLSGSSEYLVQFDTSANFSSPLLVYASALTSNYFTSNLYFNQTYFWRVRAINLVDTSGWSPVWSFTTVNQVVHTSPLNGAIGQALITEINWSGVSGASGYIYRFDTSPLFTVFPQYGNSIGTNSRADITLPLSGQTYYWQVAIVDSVDTSGWSNPWSFTTLYQIANAPVLVSPADLANGIQLSAAPLIWNSVPAVFGYEYMYSTDTNFTNSIVASTLDTTGSTAALASFTTYYWKVRAANASGYSPWSTTFSFTTLNPLTSAPLLFAPEDLAVDVPQPIAFSWYPVNLAASYIGEYAIDTAFTNALIFTTTDTFAISGTLDPLTTYYWRVRAKDGNALSPWSEVWSFTTENPLTFAPLQNAPQDQAIGIATPANFNWYSIELASSYECEYDTDSLFSAPITLLANDTSVSSLPLTPFTKYFWRVRGVLGNVSSPWSTTWRFTSDDATIPFPIYPAYADTGLLTPVTFSWNLVTVANSYECAYDTDSLFSNPIVLNSNNDTAQSLNLASYTKYFWRVRAYDGTQFYAWSPTWVFTTSVMIGLPSHASETTLSIYPNPAKDKLFVIAPNKSNETILLRLYNAYGALVWTKAYSGSINEMLNLSSYSNGLYTMIVDNGKSQTVKKLLLE